MKSKNIYGATALVLSVALLTACSKTADTDNTSDASSELTTRVIYMTDETADAGNSSTREAAEVPAGMYLSELTGEPIDEALKNQRPIAVMVDNERTALDHFGTAEADVVYEMMNSTANDRITRLMVLVKDWGSIKQLGSIRSTRPTNLLLYPEWNAVLCHDGGPAVHINAYLENDYTPRFNGSFSRVDNGKPTEFTEYILEGDLERNFTNSGISPEYDENRLEDESHFEFVPYGHAIDLETDYNDAFDASEIDMSQVFFHNGSKLIYNKDTETYDYHEYGAPHTDGEDGEVMTFKNVFLQDVVFNQLDDNGYLIYNVLDFNYNKAYYFTNGKGIEVFWQKIETLDHTRYFVYNEDGLLEEIEINAGKTYIGLIPDDSWDKLDIKK